MNADLPILLLPGTLCDAALWGRLTRPALACGPEVIRGRSLVDAAAQILEDAPPRFELLGFSLGAILAFELLRQAPARVARLTLISANPHAPSAVQLAAWESQEERVRAEAFAQVARELAALAGRHAPEVLQMALRVGPDAFLEHLHLLRSRPDSRPTLAKYGGPLTLLAGQGDAVTPVHLAEEMWRLAPQAQLRVVPEAGHYLPLDAPGAVDEALRELVHA
ncbi:alpha/beta fold hydrolase [Deinococcus sp.]|uniref:alpha/beta fold hydrolase n=1 Tax=Deinococcus sp. TaxID=47478 RepID=UPI003CC50AD9